MSILVEADQVEVLVLVDNVTDNLSSTPLFVENEWPRLRRRGMRSLSGRCLCCAAHGLSCAITVRRGVHARTLLFDTGPDEAVFERNVERLGMDVSRVEGIVLSHGHWDHCGAMLRALQMIRQRNGGRDVPTYMHPDMYRTRATKAADGTFQLFEDVPNAAQLAQHGAEVVHSTQPQSVLGDLVYISGEIPRVTDFEVGLPGQHRMTLDGSGWEPDPLIKDERFVAVAVRGKGVIVFTACSHAGVVNVLKHARGCFPDLPLYGVLGGFHLSGTNERVIPQTVDAMREFDLSVIAAAHCTGWRATSALAGAFGDAVVPSAVGKLYKF
ncbi:MAG TPA: MBL fold metallo-hydrolase [Burkholderiaceae bacterium]|nr:MBL fold metallo-hydrolase [Burkholderiaceae bacterium]